VGPPRDFDLFNDFKNNKTENINNCNYLLCTGLFDYADQDLNFYIKLFKNSVSKKMICTNPDLIVDRGENREYCAGSVAKVFEKLGGEVVYFGKPYPEIYNQSVENNNKKIIAIGDNLNTDIKGASNMNYDSLIITEGVHKEEIRKQGIEQVLKKYSAKVNFSQSVLKW
jgi:HAD superfamily hydrolase (TIGR01459 family)